MESIDIKAGDETLVLYPQRVAFWPAEKTLFVADVHLGKSASRRSQGLYIPEGADTDDLELLRSMVEKTGAEKVLVLGDMFHDSYAITDEALQMLSHWLGLLNSELSLLVGNHDRRAARKIKDLPMKIKSDAFAMGSFWLSHEPEVKAGYYTICGHLHPGIRLKDNAGCTHRSKAFWRASSQLVLPAFGATTSMATMPAQPGDMLYVCAGDQLYPVESK